MKNSNRADFVRIARDASFTKPISENYNFKRVSIEEFWNIYANDFHEHSPLDLFFEEEKLRSASQSEKLNLLNQPMANSLIEDNYLLVDNGEKVIAMVRGWQKTFDSYYMQFTAVHTGYRMKGIYSAIIDRVLHYTKLLGYSRVLSCHAPCNNAVLVAKLKKDFKIIGMDIDAALGTNIWLCYFHNQELRTAYEFRCGKLTFSQQLTAASLGTAHKLCDVINGT